MFDKKYKYIETHIVTISIILFSKINEQTILATVINIKRANIFTNSFTKSKGLMDLIEHIFIQEKSDIIFKIGTNRIAFCILSDINTPYFLVNTLYKVINPSRTQLSQKIYQFPHLQPHLLNQPLHLFQF